MDYPQRKRVRMKGHSYSNGVYFITVCTADFKHHFGYIKDNRMLYSIIGQTLSETLDNIEKHFPRIKVRHKVVMPNHFHAIISISGESASGNTPYKASLTKKGDTRERLAVVVGAIKRNVTIFACKNAIDFKWQPSFHDHIIRNMDSYNMIAEYIRLNPLRWKDDCFYGSGNNE